MLIKSIDDKNLTFRQLEALLPLATPGQKKRITKDLYALRKGYQNELQTAYLIDFAYGKKQNTLILHDLRLVFDGQVAQIDHLLINAGAIYLLESKYFSQKVTIDAHGNWTAHYDSGSHGIDSPLEQNRRHKILVSRILQQYDLIPKRLGIKVNLPIYDYVLLSTNCRIEGDIPPNVIKADRVETTIDRDLDTQLDRFFGLNTFKLLVNIITHNEMHAIADALLCFHQPLTIDYAAKYGITPPPPIDRLLLQKLTRLRDTLAKKRQTEPAAILPDNILEAFARYRPQNPKETKRLTSMNDMQFRRVGYKFLNTVLTHQKLQEKHITAEV